MIENYYYHLNQHENNTYTWDVVETQTNQTIYRFIFEDDATALLTKLINGHGFDGYTPSFFLTTWS